MAAPACSIRPCAPGDEAALALLGQASFLEAFAGTLRGSDILRHCERMHAPQVYRDWLRDPAMHLWIAEVTQGAAPVGYCVLAPADLPLPDLGEADAEVKRVYLLHRFQGLGLGRRLMDTAREQARALGRRRLLLGVYGQNHAAIGFYESLGYRPVGTRVFRVGESDCQDLILALAL
ncbi:MAG TPA: GNAT family N-acetyltransferase [Steroidobacteraceae bacterium]|nr:GNAT family N-acetyltransferase [Steroidobacteraceae bacterium]